MFGYLRPAFLALDFAADFWLDVKVFDFFLGFFFSQMGLAANVKALRLFLRASLLHRLLFLRSRRSLLAGLGVRVLFASDVRHVSS